MEPAWDIFFDKERDLFDVKEEHDFFQIPTPPSSASGVEDSETTQIVSVSSTFFPNAQVRNFPPDIVLLSADAVHFYVHSSVLVSLSKNNWASLLLAPQSDNPETLPFVQLQESSTLVNILLHTIYDLSCVQFSPTIHDIIAAVDVMPYYGLLPKRIITPSHPTFSLLLAQAPLYPIDVFALAAHHEIHDLAVTCSSHLLSFSLPSLSDELATRIGAVYLKRLFFLHFGRMDALRRILLPPPHPHPATAECDFTEQKKLTRAWALAAAYLAWDARPDLSAGSIEAALRPLGDSLSCPHCQKALNDRIRNLIVQWTVIRRTI